jgi:glycosyltransferase involved in cell wall biosynthesis
MGLPAGERDILFLLSTLGIGGSERKTVRLANSLRRRGHRVTVAYLNAPDTLLRELAPDVRAVHLQRTGKFSLRALRMLERTIRESRIDTVISLNLYAMLYAALVAKYARSLSGVRFIASLNTSTFSGASSMWLYRPLLRGMDLLIFGAEYQREFWLRHYLGGKAPQTRVLYNGIDTTHFSRDEVSPRRPPQWPAGRVVLGSVGRLSPEKSQHLLIRAIAQLHNRGLDVGAVIVGEGSEESELRRLVAELGVEDRVHFPGATADVRPWLAGFDVFVLTSTSVETFSNAVLEALAMGCPVVSSRIGGMPEMLASGGGIIYETGNLGQLVAALDELVSLPERRRALAGQTRESVLKRFSLEAMADAFMALLMIDPRRGPGSENSTYI